jgi:hypothetical protein
MPDIEQAAAAGRIRTIESSREISTFRAKRPPRSIVADAGGTAPSPATPSGITEDNGLILATYNLSADAQPTDSVHNEGGALILQAQLELVFWGTAWQTAIGPSASDVVNAVTAILGSPYLLGLMQYGFQSAAVRGSTIVTSPAPPANYSFDDVGNLVWSLIDDGKFPEPDDDGGRILYMVFMPPGTTPPSDFRGAHSDPSDYDFPADVDYAWVGYVSYGTLDYITDVFSHEFVETITNPEPHDPAWVMNRIINKGNEIGDACNNTVDRLDGILVQAYWSERQKACVIPRARGTLSGLQSIEQGCRVESGSTGGAYVSLNKPTPIDVSLSLSSDNPAVLTVQATLTIPAGRINGVVALQAEPIVGPYQFVAIHASYAGQTVTSQVEVTPRPSILTGVVTDAASNPIAQAVVVIDNGDVTGAGFGEFSTRDDGSYATETLSPDTYKVEVSASGYVPAEATVVVQEGVPITRADFALEARRPSTIAGRVEDPRGTPVVGAEVLLLQQDFNQRLTTVTDNTGIYRLSVNPADYTGRYWLKVTAPGYAEGFLDLAIPNGANLRENFVLAKLGSLTGLITDAGKTPPAPVAEASVHAHISTDDPLTPASVAATSDATGRYQLQMPPGPAGITVQASGFETYATTLTIVADGTANQDIGLVQASATLACTVSASDSGSPITNAYVNIVLGLPGPPTYDGSYTIVRIPAGQQEVDIHAEGYKPQQYSLDFTSRQTTSASFYLDPDQPDFHPDPDPM